MKCLKSVPILLFVVVTAVLIFPYAKLVLAAVTSVTVDVIRPGGTGNPVTRGVSTPFDFTGNSSGDGNQYDVITGEGKQQVIAPNGSIVMDTGWASSANYTLPGTGNWSYNSNGNATWTPPGSLPTGTYTQKGFFSVGQWRNGTPISGLSNAKSETFTMQ